MKDSAHFAKLAAGQMLGKNVRPSINGADSVHVSALMPMIITIITTTHHDTPYACKGLYHHHPHHKDNPQSDSDHAQKGSAWKNSLSSLFLSWRQHCAPTAAILNLVPAYKRPFSNSHSNLDRRTSFLFMLSLVERADFVLGKPNNIL